MYYYLPELGESELGSPDLTLAAETVGTDQLEPKFDRNVNFCTVTNMACLQQAPQLADTPSALPYLLVDQLLSLERSSGTFGSFTV